MNKKKKTDEENKVSSLENDITELKASWMPGSREKRMKKQEELDQVNSTITKLDKSLSKISEDLKNAQAVEAKEKKDAEAAAAEVAAAVAAAKAEEDTAKTKLEEAIEAQREGLEQALFENFVSPEDKNRLGITWAEGYAKNKADQHLEIIKNNATQCGRACQARARRDR